MPSKPVKKTNPEGKQVQSKQGNLFSPRKNNQHKIVCICKNNYNILNNNDSNEITILYDENTSNNSQTMEKAEKVIIETRNDSVR